MGNLETAVGAILLIIGVSAANSNRVPTAGTDFGHPLTAFGSTIMGIGGFAGSLS